MPDAAIGSSAAEHTRLLVDAAPGSVVSLQRIFEDLLVQLRLGQQLLQPFVLCLQFLQPLRLFGVHPPVLVPPAVERLLADLQSLRHLADRLAGRQHRVCLPDLPDNLLRPVLLPRHRESSLPFRAA
jgi:hypothetical protein